MFLCGVGGVGVDASVATINEGNGGGYFYLVFLSPPLVVVVGHDILNCVDRTRHRCFIAFIAFKVPLRISLQSGVAVRQQCFRGRGGDL